MASAQVRLSVENKLDMRAWVCVSCGLSSHTCASCLIRKRLRPCSGLDSCMHGSQGRTATFKCFIPIMYTPRDCDSGE